MSRSVRYASSPLLAGKTPVWRSKLVVAVFICFALLLAWKAFRVQVVDVAFYRDRADLQLVRTLDLPASRGRILDRNGAILAASAPAVSVWVSPRVIDRNGGREDGKLKELASLLGLSMAELQARIADPQRHFVWLRRQVDREVWDRVAALDIKGVYQEAEYKRYYPEGEAMAHIVGLTNMEGRGIEGVEQMFDAQLAGRAGSRQVIRTARGRIVEDVRDEILPVDGGDVQLSVDSKMQFFAWQRLREAVLAHKARSGSVIVLDVRTGEILALANYPGYNANERARLNVERMRNKALTDTFEPGSTMKPFTVALALELGRVKPQTVFDTSPGYYTVTGATIKDIRNYGPLTVEGVIQKSSNVGVTKISHRLSEQEMWENFSHLGLGQKPQIEYPGSASGRLRPWKTWRPIEKATMSYGYGLSVSLLQLARAYTVFARDGSIIPVTILRHDGPVEGESVYSPATASAMRHMLWLATGPEGGGRRAQNKVYSVAGKSGTARKQAGKTYSSGKYRSWFTGMAPVGQPRIVVAVMIDEPAAGEYYGGAVAGPVFGEVAQHCLRIMGVQPDLEVTPQIVAGVPAAEKEPL